MNDLYTLKKIKNLSLAVQQLVTGYYPGQEVLILIFILVGQTLWSPVLKLWGQFCTLVKQHIHRSVKRV